MTAARFGALAALLSISACSGTGALLQRPTAYPRDATACAPTVACEAADRNALAINLVHFRAQEAGRARTEGRNADCLAAARTAFAVARGLEKTREYEHKQGVPFAVYHTRFSGDLSEADVLRLLLRDERSAADSYRACGGALPIAYSTDEEFALFDGSPEDKERSRNFWTNFQKNLAASGAASGSDEPICLNQGAVTHDPEVCCSHKTHMEEVHGNTVSIEEVCSE